MPAAKATAPLKTLVAPIVVIAALWFVATDPADAREKDILRYDLADTVDTLVSELSEGAGQGRMTLEALDGSAHQAVTQITSGRDYQYATFSARTQTTALFNMAEAFEPGEGHRFIAKLHRKMSGNSAIVRLDPGLQAISREFTDADLDRPIRFAEARSMAPTDLIQPLPRNIEAAVELLARAMGPGGLGSMTTTMQRHLRLDRPGESGQRVIDRAILTSSSRKEAIHQVILAHSPPPGLRQAMRRLMLDVASRNAALGMDANFGRVLRDLGEESPPQKLKNFAEIGDSLQSRQSQWSATSGGAGISSTPSDAATRSRIGQILAKGGVEVEGNDGAGPSANGGPSYDANRRAHSAYGRRTFSSGVPREFSRAIRSPRAARGIAIGAKLHMPDWKPLTAFWVPAVVDDQFGRLAVQVSGRDRIAVTRFMFADSFEAAVSTLWGNHGEDAAYRENELNIVMSMDPESEIAQDQLDRILSSADEWLEDLRSRVRNSESPLDIILLETERQLQELPRGIVIHPALHGRELAWSVARVDFWFNDLERLGQEGESISGITPSASLTEAMTGAAQTWQFYERDSGIEIVEGTGSTDSLRVLSPGPEHFGVTLFAFEGTPPNSTAEEVEDGIWLLPNEQEQVQPLLDWALNNHPDFMRLNDYAEALSVLRWLDLSRADTRLIILDPDGQPGRIATPDRVMIGEVAPSAGN